jgi:hypothetical protein
MVKNIGHDKRMGAYFQQPDYDNEIKKPFGLEYYAEAFTRLDTYIDSMLEQILNMTHGSKGERDLIAAIKKTNRGFKFYEVLYVLGIISKELYTRIKEFKECRNLLVHTQWEGFGLLKRKDEGIEKKIESKEELDESAKKELKDRFNSGIDCLNEICGKMEELWGENGFEYERVSHV